MSDPVNLKPDGLGVAGALLWGKFVPTFQFEEREEEVLIQACRQADDIAGLEQAVEDEGRIVEGSRGQRRMNAVVTELRQSRLALARLLGMLKLPDDDGRPMSAKSERAQRAAFARWDRTAEVRATRKSNGAA